MKKFLIVAIGLFLTANSLLAAYQYDNYLTLTGNGYLVGQDSNLTLNVISWNDWKTSAITDWQGLIVEATDASGNVTTNTVAITGNSINIGNVNAGDTLKFYLTGTQGTTNTGGYGNWGSGWDTSVGTYEYVYFAGNYMDASSSTSNYISVAFQITGGPATGPAPTGQPLPGALAALLVGGAGAGAFAFRRKKAVAAN